MVDLAALRSARPEALSDAARSWRTISDQLDTRVSGMKSQVIAPLKDDWSGQAANAALGTLNGRAQDLMVTREYADTMAAVLRDAATGITDAQSYLKAAENLADRGHLTIGADGSVTPHESLLATVAEKAADAVESIFEKPPEQTAQEKEVSDLVKRALSIANETDTQVTAQLKAIGFFRGAATGNLAAAQAQLAAAEKLSGTLDRSAIPPKGTNPAEVNAWWKSLSAADQKRLTAQFPSQIGWLDGLPATARDSANRTVMTHEKTSLTAQLQSLEGHEPQQYRTGFPGPVENPAWVQWNAKVSEIKKELNQISGVENGMASAEKTTGQQAYLLGFDTTGTGHAIVAVGNPDTATNTVTFVPGLASHLGTTSSGLGNGQTDIGRAAAMWQQANRYASPGQKISSVYWLGYNPPQFSPVSSLVKVAGTSDAIAGAHNLGSFQAGLGAAHQAGVANHTTVLGHSYGSLVVGQAAVRDNLKPTDIAFVGSPGVGVDHATQLGMSPQHVWAGANKDDPVPWVNDIHWFGNNPATAPFGGQGFDANQTPGQSYFPGDSNAHESYWDPGSSSLKNIAHIADQQYGAVSRAH